MSPLLQKRQRIRDIVPHTGMILLVTHHLKCPNSPDPNLELAFYTFYALEIDAFPPAPAGRFSPEKQELLCHADSVIARQVIALHICS